MTSHNSNQWDLGRFIKTLSYYGAIPFLSQLDWFQQWLGNRPELKVDSRDLMPTATQAIDSTAGHIWVVGASSSIGTQVVQQLTAQGQAVCTDAVMSGQGMRQEPSQIKAVICCPDVDETTLEVVTPLIRSLEAFGHSDRTIFDFEHPTGDLQQIWGALDDVVMGGVSQSNIRLGDQVAYFSGNVSTANSGGFASIRTRDLEPPLDLSAYDGVVLRVKGDGKRYKFMIRTETRWDGVAHCYSFDTTPDQWLTVHIPFEQLIPVFRARTIDNSPFHSNQIYAWQLMLSKFEYDGALNPHFEPGLFQLQIKSIQVYSQSDRSKFILINPSPEAATTIKASGIPYTIFYPTRLSESASGKTFQVSRQPLTGEVSPATVAACCITALNHSGARNKTLYVTGGEDLGSWE